MKPRNLASYCIGALAGLALACASSAQPPQAQTAATNTASGTQATSEDPDLAAAQAQPAELVLRGGDIMTMDPSMPRASAVAVRGGRIVAVGDDAAMAAWIAKDTRVIELGGRSVTPGLIDGHCHLYGLGAALESVSLRGAKSPEEAAKTTAEAAAALPAGEWVTGRGWDQNLWPSKEFPTAAMLDAAIADRPVALDRIDGHALWANSAALRAAGITAATKDPPGGRIVRDRRGKPTGVFIDAAMRLIESRIPEPSAEVRERRILRAAEAALAAGITAVHEMGIQDSTIAVYRDLAARGALPLRVYAYLGGTPELVAGLAERPPDASDPSAYFVLRGVKLFADGALGSRGASLLAPYSDDAKNRGIWVTPPADLTRQVEAIVAAGWQPAVHAIGDAANRAVLDAYEAATKTHPDRDLRLRIEHAQVVAPGDIGRFATLKVLASMQPTHATSDMPWAETRLGPERIRGAYAWRSLLDGGARIVAGSDFPVEEVPPLHGIYAAVTRQDRTGHPQGGWYPGERMTLDEALRAFTLEPAFAAWMEGERGMLRPGYVADLTVYDRPLRADASLLSAAIDMTVVGGRPVFERR